MQGKGNLFLRTKNPRGRKATIIRNILPVLSHYFYLKGWALLLTQLYPLGKSTYLLQENTSPMFTLCDYFNTKEQYISKIINKLK